MALNPELIKFFISRISSSSMRTFGSEVSLLFFHLDSEVKDNPMYEKYEMERKEWENWPNSNNDNSFSGQWFLPTDYDKAKSLAYDIYKTISNMKERGYNYPIHLVGGKNIDEAIYKFNGMFMDYFIKSLDDIINANPELEETVVQKVKGNTVFIIHGHDNSLKTEVQLLLERAGVRYVVLHEIADKGRTIIDKLVEEGKTSNYAIALFSPDDKLIDGNNRARQNVVLEVGYFMGILGKERVRMIVKDEIEIPSDLSGILYEKHDSIGAWRMKILKELQAAGIFVDFQNVFDKL